MLAELERQIGGHRSKLANESFVARAPAEVVEQTRSKLAELEAQREAVSLARPVGVRAGRGTVAGRSDSGSRGGWPSPSERSAPAVDNPLALAGDP